MTREEAIRELKADYCGNRIICELHPDQCNREDCEIWLAIKTLETQPDGDCISRRVAVDESGYCDPFGNPIYVCLRIGGNDVALKAYDIVKAVEGVVTEGRITRFPEDQTSVACVKPTKAEMEIEQLPSAQPDLCDGCDRYGASCVGEGCGKLEMPEVTKDTNVPINNCISRQAVKEIRNDGTYIGYSLFPDDNADYEYGFTDAINKVLALPSAQPDITPDGTLTVSIDADIASVGRILLSQTGTQYGGLYYKDAEPEETCDTCKHGYFGDSQCENCRVRYPSHYERRTE